MILLLLWTLYMVNSLAETRIDRILQAEAKIPYSSENS
jgi:hypothetical protein